MARELVRSSWHDRGGLPIRNRSCDLKKSRSPTPTSQRDLTHPEDRQGGDLLLQRLWGGEAIRHSAPLRLRHHDGHLIACQVYFARVGGVGTPGTLLCQLHELPGPLTPVSTQPPTQPQPRPVLQRFGDNLPSGCLFQAIGNEVSSLRFLYLSAGCQNLTEFAPSALLADTSQLTAQLDAAEQARLLNAFLVAQRDQSALDLQLCTTPLSGRRPWIHLRATPHRPPGGAPTLWDGVALDITERGVRLSR